MVKYGGRGLLVFFEPLTKSSRGLSYIFIFTLHPSTFITVDDPTLLHHGVFIFGVHQEVLDGSPSLEEHLHTIVTAFIFDTFTQPLIVWNSYVGSGSVALLSVLVLLFVLLGWIVQLYLDPVQSPSRVIAVAQCSLLVASLDCWSLWFLPCGRGFHPYPSLNRNVGKYHLPHIWDEVLFNIPELKIKH